MATAFTPILEDDLGADYTTSINEAWYIKQGDILHFTINIEWTARASSSAVLRITLPFAAKYPTAITLGKNSGLEAAPGTDLMMAHMEGASNYIKFTAISSTTGLLTYVRAQDTNTSGSICATGTILL